MSGGHGRRRSGGRRGGHDEAHGGQWKIAYADFVTAMMAFFLLMWLVSSATETQRAVIARYFTTTSLFDLPKGNGVLDGGKAVMDGAEAKTERMHPSGAGGAQIPKDPSSSQSNPANDPAKDANSQGGNAQAAKDAKQEGQRFDALKSEFEQMLHQTDLKELSKNMSVDMTSEGLRIQIFDRDGEPMFASGDTEPTPRLSRILDMVAQVLQSVKNKIIVTGHTDSQVLKRGAYTNWELSSDRANAVRRRLEGDGLAGERMLRVVGLAATDPLLPLTPLDPRNRRIAITVVRSDVEAKIREPSAPAGTGTAP